MQPIVIHLDMNSYFATAEQQNNPLWRGKPLGVCEHLGGIIIAASVEAKRWGIKTGTPVWEARKLYPKIILTKTTPNIYRLYIKRVVKVVSDYTAFVEQASIDELYMDITKECNVKIPNPPAGGQKSEILNSELVNPFEEAIKIAKEIKKRMKTEVGDYLTCSIGIAENKLLAKIASDMQKPDGLVIVTSDELRVTSGKELMVTKEQLYSKLKLTDIPGIGRRQVRNLENLGIKTLLDLKKYPKSLLVARFGINGHHLHKMGQLEGSWKPKVEADSNIKSIGHMYTLPKEYRKKKFFEPVLYKLCEMVARRLRKQNLSGNIVHFFVRFNSRHEEKRSESAGASHALSFYIFDGREIFLECLAIYKTWKLNEEDFRLIGVTVAGLRPYVNQLTLFGSQEKDRSICKALDKINLKYGEFTVSRATVLSAKNVFHDSVGFGRVKEV